MSSADAAHLLSDAGALHSGVGASIVHGELLAPDGAPIDLYVSNEIHEALASIVAGVADPLGSVVLRIVSDEMWPEV